MNLARMRKAVVALIGTAAALVVLVPEETIPEAWRPWVGILLGLATVLGVYRVRNDAPVRPNQAAANEVFGPRRKMQRPFSNHEE